MYWEGRGVYMGVYYADLSIVQFRAMMLGIHVYVYIGSLFPGVRSESVGCHYKSQEDNDLLFCFGLHSD